MFKDIYLMVVNEPSKVYPASFSELKCPFHRMSGKETKSSFMLHCMYIDGGAGKDIKFRVNTQKILTIL